jgi:Flp pilus assembly protein TadG
MRRKKNISKRRGEQGVVITLVAVFMLGVIGAMAALSIDLVTLYTARSEAQLAADAAALAGARVLANSGMTSMTSTSDTTVGTNAVPLAIAVATQVAATSTVGGRTLNPGGSPCVAGQEICVSIPTGSLDFVPNPQVTVKVQRTDLPTFFARIWGTRQVAVAASATAEAYNPSSLAGTGNSGPPIAPLCVKPWLLPNMSPTATGGLIFDPASGAIQDATLLGWRTPNGGGATRLRADCTTTCATAAPSVWRYYPGDPADFPAPGASSVPGSAGFGNPSYQLSIAGCVQTPISCNGKVNVYIANTDANLDTETGTAVNVLTHSNGNGGDSVDINPPPPPTGTAPFEFLAGTDNPMVLSGAINSGTDIMVSDSLVTVPIIDSTTGPWPPASFPQVQIIGFVQLFLNPNGQAAQFNGHIRTQVVNLVGCGDGIGGVSAGNPIIGNGASPVAVRLISQ